MGPSPRRAQESSLSRWIYNPARQPTGHSKVRDARKQWLPSVPSVWVYLRAQPFLQCSSWQCCLFGELFFFFFNGRNCVDETRIPRVRKETPVPHVCSENHTPCLPVSLTSSKITDSWLPTLRCASDISWKQILKILCSRQEPLVSTELRVYQGWVSVAPTDPHRECLAGWFEREASFYFTTPHTHWIEDSRIYVWTSLLVFHVGKSPENRSRSLR